MNLKKRKSLLQNFKSFLYRVFRSLGCEYESIELCNHDWTPAQVRLPMRLLISLTFKDGEETYTRCCTKCNEVHIAQWQSMMTEDQEMAELHSKLKNVKPEDFKCQTKINYWNLNLNAPNVDGEGE